MNAAESKHNKNYELTPPNIHRCNAAERAIRICKNHMLAGFVMCDKNFPGAEWDYLIPQAKSRSIY